MFFYFLKIRKIIKKDYFDFKDQPILHEFEDSNFKEYLFFIFLKPL
jgi:hypothetical protein